MLFTVGYQCTLPSWHSSYNCGVLNQRTSTTNIVVLYWQKAASYGQTKLYEILQFVAGQSTAKPHVDQQQQGAETLEVEPTWKQAKKQHSGSSSIGANQLQPVETQEAVPPTAPTSATNAQTTDNSSNTGQTKQGEIEEMKAEPVLYSYPYQKMISPTKETLFAETIHVTGG
ncbi:hypothetical protein IFM89_001194, partial [Coptis chinensis]